MKFGIRNFRVFDNSKMTTFDFSPITLLVGANNTGKSSLLKSLLLLQNSIDSNGQITQLNFEGLDIGSHAMNLSEKDQLMVVKLPFGFFESDFIGLFFNDKGYCTAIVIQKSDGKEILKITPNNTFNIDLPYIKHCLQRSKKYDSIEKGLLKYTNGILITSEEEDILLKDIGSSLSEYGQAITRYEEEDEDYYTTSWEVQGKYDEIYCYLRKASRLIKNNLEITQEGKLFFSSITERLQKSFKDLASIFKDIVYIPSKTRIPAAIVHTTNEISILSQYINHKHNLEYNDYSASKEMQFDSLLLEISKELNISKLIIKNIGEEYGTTHLVPFVKRTDGKEIPLANCGTGIIQLITILLVIVYNDRTIILLEEPESNLHPKLQTALASILLKNTEHTYLIETHSENLLRGFMLAVAQKTPIIEAYRKRDVFMAELFPDEIEEFSKNFCKIYLFNDVKSNEEVKLIDEIFIREDGAIDYSKFNNGFFDTSYNLQYSLLNIQRDKFFEELDKLRAELSNGSQLEEDGFAQKLAEKVDFFIKGQNITTYKERVKDYLQDANGGDRSHKINDKTLSYLASAEFLMANMGNSPDYLPVVFQYGLAVENELKTCFEDTLKDKFNEFIRNDINILTASFSFLQKKNSGFFNTPFSFFQMQYCLAIAKSGIADNKPFFRDFKATLNNLFNLSTLWNIEFLENQLVDKIRKNRNDAGHGKDVFDKTKAENMQRLVIEFFQLWLDAKL
jgi:predicted ATPase